jgi:hypothetical protein
LHIEKEDPDMRNALQADGNGLTTRFGNRQHAMSAGQRWRAFALLVAAYFITIVDSTTTGFSST